MPQFPQRDLTNQYISTSYQDVVQRYASGSNSYLLDGLGYSILAIPTSSLGEVVLTQDQTASFAVSASWAPPIPSNFSVSSSWASASISASYADRALSASWAPSTGGGPAVSASWASQSFHSQTSDLSISSSYSLFAELSNTASVAIMTEFADTASLAGFAYTAGSASWSSASFVATSASYASASTLALIADVALVADTASFAQTASHVEFVGEEGYVPTWQNNQLTETSSILTSGDNGQFVTVNSHSFYDPQHQPALFVTQKDPVSVNAGYFEGDTDNFIQIVMSNKSTGSGASSDLIGQPDDGENISHYIDLGINSTQYSQSGYTLQDPGAGYLYVEGGNLSVGTRTPGFVTKFHVGGTDIENEVGRIDVDGFSLTGSITTASFVTTASNAISASNIIPGATFYQVSGSNGYPAAYFEPYDFCATNELYMPPYKVGRVFYDNRYDDWAWYPNTGSNPTTPAFRSHLGKELIINVHNPYSVPLTRFSAVYISSSSDNADYRPSVYLAQADATHQHSEVAGIIRNTIPSGSNGYMLIKGTMHRTNMAGFTAGQKLWLSTTVPGGMTGVQPGYPNEQIFLGYCTETGSLGSFLCDIGSIPEAPNVYAGITSIPEFTNNNDGTITIASCSVNLYSNIQALGGVTGYTVPAATLTASLGVNIVNFLFIDYNGGVPRYLIDNSNSGNSLTRVAAGFFTARYIPEGTGSYDINYGSNTTVGLGLANKMQAANVFIWGIQRQSGFTIFETGSLGLGITAGSAWFGIRNFQPPTVNSTSGSSGRMYFFYHSASTWTFQEPVNTGSNAYYDNGTGLSLMSSSYYNAGFLYRNIATPDEFYYVLANSQYATQNDALTAQPPGDIPAYIRLFGMLAGRVIIQSGSLSVSRIDSAFDTTFIPTSVNEHNSLTGLQGGMGGEYYHLSLEEYTGTGTGSQFVRANAPTMSNVRFEGSSIGHIPYWSEDHTLTLTGSIQVVQDGPGTPFEHVLINSGSFPDPDNPETLLVKQDHSSSVNNLGCYSTVEDFSQIYNQNLATHPSASSDIVATNDIGNQSSHYIDMGIGSSVYADARFPWYKPNDAWVEMDGGDLWLSQLDSGSVRVLISGSTNPTEVAVFGATGIQTSGSLYGTASYARNAGFTVSSSFASRSISSSHTLFADESITASYTLTAASAVVSQFATSASYSNNSDNARFSISSSFASRSISASFVPNLYPQTEQISSSWASASFVAVSASFASRSISASFVPNLYPQTEQISASWASASFVATSASFASQSISASWSPVPVSASWASASIFARSSSFASQSISSAFATTSSFSVTSSFALGLPSIKAGIISGSTFVGTPLTASVTFTKVFSNNNYSVVVTGEGSRTWTVESKSAAGFTVNSNSDVTFTELVFWHATTVGEYY